MIVRPPRKRPAGRQPARATIEYGFSVLPPLRSAHLLLDALASDPHMPLVWRGLARLAAVPVHRLVLLITSGADVDAAGYLANTLDTAAETSRALIESIDPLDPNLLPTGPDSG